jgi:site-specific DNA-methyltransferase (adenine-specific)
MKRTKLMLGDNIESLRKLPDNSIDSVVTDPPYGLSFMNKKWDHDVPSIEFWREVYRVLKPGGHILSFGGTRTYHRMVVNIEDAGFEIRDQIQWIYSTGFPKSHNIGKAVKKIQGNDR